jgi:hypothetical protein
MNTYVFDDGGRAAAGFKGSTGDCVTRAIAIATGKPYREVYDEIFQLMRGHSGTIRTKERVRMTFRADGTKTQKRIAARNLPASSPRNGVAKDICRAYMERLGWKWVPCMSIGAGCTVHLRADELPAGKVIASVSKHWVAVIDGVIRDTFDPSRGGTRCVYGYWVQP